MRLFAYLLMSLFLISTASANIVINEIMYNPSGSDTNREWIEIYNNANISVNLTNWKFLEANVDHSLKLGQGKMIIPPRAYAVIVQNISVFLKDHKNYSGTIIDASFSLSNTGEYIALKNS